jgi:ribonuclease HII
MTNFNNISKKLFTFEREILPQGCGLIAGLDEAGRGPLAGPVVAAAVVLPLGAPIDGVFDSKALSPAKREKVFFKIVNRAIDIGIGLVGQDLIDQINILQSTIQAMRQALNKLIVKPEFILIDALSIPETCKIPQKAVIKGDQKCYSIAAASIVAKVVRDRLMKKFHLKYPEYNFESNKGYGTQEHLKALASVGPCPLHRRSFKRVKELCIAENSS